MLRSSRALSNHTPETKAVEEQPVEGPRSTTVSRDFPGTDRQDRCGGSPVEKVSANGMSAKKPGARQKK